MSLKTILLLIFTGLYFWAGQYWYTCIAKKVCGDGEPTATVVDTPEAVVDYGPITFKYNDSNAYAGPTSFNSAKDSILSGKTGDNKLEIIGHYFKGETPEIGMKRAESVRALLVNDFSGQRMRLTAKDMSNQEVDKASNFAAVDFKWIEAETEVEVKTTEVIQLADRAVMLFPTGGAVPERDTKLEEYLDKLTKRVKETGEKIELTGHTDNTGSTATNQELGMKRANTIKRILVRKGVAKNLITIDSKGETQPVATNDSDAGRHQNRRVEVKLNKEQ